MISFFLDIVPFKATHHAKKIVRRGRFVGLADKPELVKARQTYESLLIPYKPEKPLDGAIFMQLVFYFPFNKSHSKKFREFPRYHTSKPDCSNLAKTFEDCLARMGFFSNDSRVARLEVSKHFSDNPGIQVYIQEAQ